YSSVLLSELFGKRWICQHRRPLFFQPRNGLEDVIGNDHDIEKPYQELYPEIQPTLTGKQAGFKEGHQQFKQKAGTCPDGIPTSPAGKQGFGALIRQTGDTYG